MTRRQQLRAAALSFTRTLGACAATAWATLGFHDPFALTVADLHALAKATVAALALLGLNWLRAGETRFGRGAEPVPAGTSVPEPAAAGGHVQVLEDQVLEEVELVDELPPAPADGD